MRTAGFKKYFWYLCVVFVIACFVGISPERAFAGKLGLGLNLKQIKRIDLDGEIFYVKVSGHMLYVAAGPKGIYEIYKKYPKFAVVNRQYTIDEKIEKTLALDVGNGYIYAILAVIDPVHGWLLTTRLEVIDLDTFTRVGSYDFGGSYGGLGGDVVVSDNYVYTMSGTGLQVFDVTNPTNPVHADGLMPFSSYGGYKDIKIVGHIAYVSTIGRGIATIDITDPYNLQLMDAIDLSQIIPGITSLGLYGFDINGSYLFATNMVPGLAVIDIRDAYNLQYIKNIKLRWVFGFPTASFDKYINLTINNSHAFLTSYTGVGRVLNISDIDKIKVNGHYNTGNYSANGDYREPCVEGLIYLPKRDTGSGIIQGEGCIIIFDRRSL